MEKVNKKQWERLRGKCKDLIGTNADMMKAIGTLRGNIAGLSQVNQRLSLENVALRDELSRTLKYRFRTWWRKYVYPRGKTRKEVPRG